MQSNDKAAAIWWRVSTDDQREISPETQVRESKAMAEREGYVVDPEHVIGTDWHSLSVWESPPTGSYSAPCATSTACRYSADSGRCQRGRWGR